ncbi:MAG: 4Fe-4S dicluster domain-containing protein [Magnetococcales bacterium]|nr:4Fe-4S dicluster domain-containing protein [Magnetococcales bacterium]
MERRTFLQRLTTTAAVIAGAATPYGLARVMSPDAHAAPHTHLRPPGALTDDRAFVEACIGCGLCGEVCPVHAIQFYGREGGSKVNTPYINPVKKACTLSGHCMEVCPTDALTVTPKREVAMGIAQIDRAGCYPWVDRGVCGACVTACPLGQEAITFAFANFYRPVVLKGCVGCGVCVEVCPHPSLPIRIVDRSLAKYAPEKITPEMSIPQEATVVVPSPPANGSTAPNPTGSGKGEPAGLLPF